MEEEKNKIILMMVQFWILKDNIYFRDKLANATNGGEECASARLLYLEEINTCNQMPCLPGISLKFLAYLVFPLKILLSWYFLEKCCFPGISLKSFAYLVFP